MLDESTVDRLARTLDDARLERRAIAPLTNEHPGLDLATGYRIQARGIELRRARGETIAGWKMGLTSEAKRAQMNLHSPCYGVLLGETRLPDGGAFEVGAGIHPKIEPEIAFRTTRELRGDIDRATALAAIDGACAAMEILDSRFRGFRYFSLPDVVADNSSSSHYVLGPWVDPQGLSFAALELRMHVDGELVRSARGEAISGDPILSIVQLVGMLATEGKSLPAGSVVLAGAATEAVPLTPGLEVRLDVDRLGSVSLRAV